MEQSKYAICIKNDGYPASLQLWKVYRLISDERALRRNLVRVIDESGEDYLFSQSYFVPVTLPQRAEAALMTLA